MPRAKKIPATIVPKERPSDPFKHALEAACKRLEIAIEERSLCHAKLSHLAVEIPSLERTVIALKEQLNPRKQVVVQPTALPTYVPPAMLPQESLEESAEAELARLTHRPQIQMPVNIPQPVPHPMQSTDIDRLRAAVLNDEGTF